MTMDREQLQRFVDEARNIVDGYVDNLPDGVSIDTTEDACTTPLPLRTVVETSSAVYVLAWIAIPKDYDFPQDPFAPAAAGDDQ
jgi:hypothetical protein